jgi:hypothetical protein
MSANPEIEEGIVTLPLPEAPATPEPEPVSGPEPVALRTKERRSKPPWLKTAVLGAAALVATGTLGYVANTAGQQRNQAYDAFVSTRATLVATDTALNQAKQDAATKKVTADYVSMYVADTGRIETDYQVLSACDSFGSCRTGSQQLLEDLQKFQSDRSAATVPSGLSASDASMGDALSAAIAADAEIVSGMDSGNFNKFKDGFQKLDAAMLNVAKAEASLGTALK